MSDVKRYDCNGRVRPMQENPEGPWVMHSDYAALRARVAEVEKERDGWLSASVDQQKRAQRAEAALATARRDAAIHIYTMENDGTKPAWIHQGAWAYTIEQASHRAMQAPIRALANEAET
jgi:hypothetical protein